MFRIVLGILAVLSVGACASPYVATPYDRASANVESIVVADDSVPEKAIAYFSIDGHLYGLSNQVRTCKTAEEFYEVMRQQFTIFKSTVSVSRKESDKLLQAS